MKQRITVQCLSLIDGSMCEVTANVTADTEQEAVNKLFTIAKDDIAYRYLGHRGIIAPERRNSAHTDGGSTREFSSV